MGAFGEKLRRQRELRGISLDAISTVTKISPRMLRAIEEEHFDQLPGGVFNKGFVRAYARQVGLNEEEAVSDYLAALRENQIHNQTVAPNFRAPAGNSFEEARESAADHPDQGNGQSNGGAAKPGRSGNSPVENWPAHDRRLEQRRKETRRTADRSADRTEDHNEAHAGYEGFAKSGISASEPARDLNEPRMAHPVPEDLGKEAPLEDRSRGFSGGSVPSFLNLSTPAAVSVEDTEPPAGENPNKVPWASLAAVLLLITLVLGYWALRHRRLPGTDSPSASSQAAAPAQPPATGALTVAAAAASPPAPAKPQAASRPRPVSPDQAQATPAPGADPTPARPHAQPAGTNAPSSFRLVIRAAQTSWVSISADGQPYAQETLIAPANTSVRATREIVVKAGNSAGISFLFNGKEIPASGNPGEVRTFTFDASGLHAPTP